MDLSLNSTIYGIRMSGALRFHFQKISKSGILQAGVKPIPETELLIRKVEKLPKALFEEAVHYIDYLSQKAQSAFFAEKQQCFFIFNS